MYYGINIYIGLIRTPVRVASSVKARGVLENQKKREPLHYTPVMIRIGVMQGHHTRCIEILTARTHSLAWSCTSECQCGILCKSYFVTIQ